MLPIASAYKEEFAKAYIEYDPDLANQLLDEMGLDKRDSEGFRLRPDGRRLSITIDYTESDTPKTPTLELVKEYWEAVGVQTQLNYMTNTLVAERAGELVGFACQGPGRGEPGGLELYALYTRAAWWGTGLGTALLAGSLGDLPAYLWVLEGNARAIAFYEKHGFRLDGGVEDEEEGRHLRMVRGLPSRSAGPDRT